MNAFALHLAQVLASLVSLLPITVDEALADTTSLVLTTNLGLSVAFRTQTTSSPAADKLLAEMVSVSTLPPITIGAEHNGSSMDPAGRMCRYVKSIFII